MDRIQDYYGGYKEGSKVAGYVYSYLQRDIDEGKLDRLFRFLTYYHPYRFGAPGIAELEKSISDALYRKKGEDVHIVKNYTTIEGTILLTDEEKEESDILLKAEGGLNNMLNKLTKAKRFKK